MDQLDAITDQIQAEFEQVNAARDQAYQRSRQLISLCARAIRAVHREEFTEAEQLLTTAKQAAINGHDRKERRCRKGILADGIT